MSTNDETDSRLRRALDQIEDGVFLLDREWRYTFVNRSVEAHGAVLNVVSAPGEGVTFTIALPPP